MLIVINITNQFLRDKIYTILTIAWVQQMITVPQVSDISTLFYCASGRVKSNLMMFEGLWLFVAGCDSLLRQNCDIFYFQSVKNDL